MQDPVPDESQERQMKPSEIYALPTDYVENLFYADGEILQEIFAIDGLRSFDFEDEDQNGETELMIHRKADLSIDSNNWVGLHTVEFNKVPFALAKKLSTDHSGNDVDGYVTDEKTFEAARAWILAKMRKGLEDGMLVDPDVDLELDFDGAALANVRGNVRLIHASHTSHHAGIPIFDEAAVVREYESRIRPLEAEPGYVGGLTSAKGGAAAVDIILDAVIAEKKVRVGEWANANLWIAGFFVADGETYRVGVSKSGLMEKATNWHRDIHITRVGFSPMFDLIESFHNEGKVDLDSKAAVEYGKAFDLTEEEVNYVVGRVAQGDVRDFLTAAVDAVSDRDPAADKRDDWIVHATLLTENPKLAVYGFGQTTGIAGARSMFDSWQKIRQRHAGEAAAKL
jgi:hypothetical protein